MQAQRLEAQLASALERGSTAADIAPLAASIAEVYARALLHDPSDSETLLAAADTLNGVERVSPGSGYAQDALGYARRAAELGPYHWRTLAIYADALDAVGETALATETRRRAQELAPPTEQLAP
jgi:tetratricopeptide (TPR) repeat protein